MGQLRPPTHLFAADHLFGARRGRFAHRFVRVKLDINVGVTGQIVVDKLAPAILLSRFANEFAVQIVFAGPHLAIMRIVLADHGGGVERGIVDTGHGIVHIHGTFRRKYDGALISIRRPRLL